MLPLVGLSAERCSWPDTPARERAAIAELVKGARDFGEDITGPEGLLTPITAGQGQRPHRAGRAEDPCVWSPAA
jgi:hypothetical protein